MTAITASPVSVDFHGTAIPTFNLEGVVRVAMRPICDAIGLDWEGQRQRIRRHPVLSKGACMIKAPSGRGIQKFLTLPLNNLNGWLFGIDTSRVKPEIRERLVEYQAECFEVLANYWQQGGAVNPRFTTVDERRPLNRAVRTLANLRSARGEAADYAGMWKLVNGYLGVAHIEDASETQLGQAMAFVQEQIEQEATRVIEGTWMQAERAMPAAPAPAATLDDIALGNLYCLYVHFKRLDEIYRRHHLGEALGLLGSRAGVEMHDHLRDGAMIADSLARRLQPEFAQMRGLQERLRHL